MKSHARQKNTTVQHSRTSYWIAALLMVIGLASLFFTDTVQQTSSDADIVRSFEASAGCGYVVHYGENLFRIGLRYGVTYQYLAALNGIPNPHFIYAGQTLSVPCTAYPNPIPPYHPANCAPSQTYLVKPGDNLFRIALNHETTIDLIRSANGLYGRVLRPNMNLIIPCPGSVKYREVPTVTPTTEAGAPQPTAAPQQSNVVRLKNGAYRPPQLTVPLGSTVIWTNTEAADGPSYTVTFGKPGQPNTIVPFDAEVAPGSSTQFTFTEAGIYDYFSRLNPENTGKIKVTQ